MEKGFTVTKKMAEKYQVRHTSGGYWADIVLDSGENSGRVQVASDFGDWQYYWGACGEDFKTFLIGLDMDYVAGKTGNDQYFDLENTLASYRRDVLEERESGAVDFDLAVCLLDQIGSLDAVSDENEFCQKLRADCPDLLAYYDYCPTIERSVSPLFKRFWEEIWGVFIDYLKKENNS